MKKNDPYNDIKTYHLADKVGPDGRMSALCFTQPRAIGKNQRWTIDRRAVTCRKCRARIAGIAVIIEEKCREARLLIAVSFSFETTVPAWMWRRLERWQRIRARVCR